ncbi:hypothetical protein Tco_1215012 [Tanacetum coccineum]
MYTSSSHNTKCIYQTQMQEIATITPQSESVSLKKTVYPEPAQRYKDDAKELGHSLAKQSGMQTKWDTVALKLARDLALKAKGMPG